MSKEKDTQQMSLLEDSPANPSALQEKEKEQMTIDISGMKLLELSESVNLDGSLGKMLKALLTSKTAWSSDRCVMTWKKKVSKSNVLLFQLQASVHGIKGKESGFLPTPTTMDHIDRKGMRPSRAATNRKTGYLSEMIKMYPTPTSVQRPNEGNMRIMRKQVLQGNISKEEASAMVGKDVFKAHGKVKMYPTPSASCQMDVVAPPETVKQNSKGWSVTRVGTGTKFGAKLNDVVNKINNKPGGKLNPTFVEFLMGYPMDWTKIEPTESKLLETQSFHKSQENLEKQLLKQKKMYRTPTAMDVAEDSFVFAAKLLKGKINRSSNSRVQITLSTDVAMEYLKSNPHLIDEYDKPFKIRPNLPNKFEFISYLKSNSSIKDLTNKTDIPKTKIEHWFRKDKCFSYPTIEDWNKIKSHLKKIQFDNDMTYEINDDWKL
jgi:hypothetical protein